MDRSCEFTVQKHTAVCQEVNVFPNKKTFCNSDCIGLQRGYVKEMFTLWMTCHFNH